MYSQLIFFVPVNFFFRVLNLSWWRSYLHVLSFLWVFGSISTSLLLKMTSLWNCFLLNCHMEKLIGEGIIIQRPKKSLHVVCWKKVNYAFLLFLLIRTLVCLSISMHELYFIITCIVFYIIVSGLFIIMIGSTKDYCGFCPHEDKVYHPLQGFTAGIRWWFSCFLLRSFLQPICRKLYWSATLFPPNSILPYTPSASKGIFPQIHLL